MKRLLIIAIIAFVYGCSPTRVPQYRILNGSDDITSPRDSSIRYILASDFAYRIKVRYHDGRMDLIDFSQLWGYIGEKGDIYRFYKNKIYTVTSVGDEVKYLRKEQRRVGRGTGNFVVKYHSTGLNGEIVQDSSFL